MALRNQVRYAEQPVQPIHQPAQQPHPQRQKKLKHRTLVTKREKWLYLAFVMVVAIMSITILHKQSEIQTATISIQELERSITTVANENVNYKVQISEKSTFERIMAIAKERGLTSNKNNVKVVPGE